MEIVCNTHNIKLCVMYIYKAYTTYAHIYACIKCTYAYICKILIT